MPAAESRLRHREAHPDRMQARELVTSLVASGRLAKPDRCSKCGHGGVIQGHHYAGYDIEHAHLVEWLCQDCHTDAHFWMRHSQPN